MINVKQKDGVSDRDRKDIKMARQSHLCGPVLAHNKRCTNRTDAKTYHT
jgi:hypothetical protein